ncbi:MAG: D-alanine--D-alanine ligase [Bacteroidales bacterium]|nr:D-alanine--D-alanine ligase [Bacteroidales bacterium]
MMTKKNIALVMGGYSGEFDISIASGNQVFEQLDHGRYNVYKIVITRAEWYGLAPDGAKLPVDRNDFSITIDGRQVRFDLAFIIIHGNPGENGVLQGYFDMLGIKYTTCGFYTSSLTFHKGYCNPVVAATGLVKVARSVLLYEEPEAQKLADMTASLRYPLFVKPAAGGSSVATTKVKRPEELLAAVRTAFGEDRQVMVEECITGREFDCGVFFTGREKLVFPITEIIPLGGHEFFDYEAKYEGFSNEVTPAEVEEEVSKHIQEVSARLYDLLGCRGIVRFDYIYDTGAKELYFLEVNTIPGQSAESIVPKQARAMGISPAELYGMAIEAALAD